MGSSSAPSGSSFLTRFGTWKTDVAQGTTTLDEGAVAVWRMSGSNAGKPIAVADLVARIVPDDQPGFIAHYDQISKLGGAAVSEFRVIGDDGAVHWIQARYQFALDRGGMCGRGACIDVTDIHPWSGTIPEPIVSCARVVGSEGDSLNTAATLAMDLRVALGKSGHGALRLAADLLLWEINTALAARHTISDKAVPGLSSPSR